MLKNVFVIIKFFVNVKKPIDLLIWKKVVQNM